MNSLGGPSMLEELLVGKEGEHLEFKEANNRFSFEELGRYCSALANEGGGRVVLGVTNSRPRRVVGSSAFEQPERTRNSLCEKTRLKIDFEEINHPDCAPKTRVLVFHVPSRPIGMAVQFGGQCWMREGDSLVPLSPERLRTIFNESGHDFTAEICPGLSQLDLDPDAIEDFRRRWIEKATKVGDTLLVERVRSFDHAQLLADLEATVDGQVSYAGLILFGTRPAIGRLLSQAEVIFEYRSSDAAGPAQDRREYRHGLFSFYDDLWNQVNLRNERQDFQEGLFVTPISTFSERTVREAILNAVCHRNYQMGGCVFVRQYPRRMEIDSPGGFPIGVTVENIIDKQHPRNRRIADILTRCGLVERSGQGMNLIYEELAKQSKPAPDFSRTDEHSVCLTLHGTVQDPKFIRFADRVSKETQAFFSTWDWLLMSAASRNEKAPIRAGDRVDRLVDLGVIERGKGRKLMLSRRYYEFVGKSGAYTRRKGLDREQNLMLLLKHIRENAAAGSKLEVLCQVLPSLPTSHVQSLLRTLKRRGLTHPVGKRKVGIWFPGPPPEDARDPGEAGKE